MGKDIIRDGKKVRYCDFNIVRSNPITYHIYFSKWHEFLFPIAPPKNFFIILLQAIVWVLQILPFGWVVSLIYSYRRIKRAKKEVRKF